MELSHGIISDYLSETLSKALRQHLKLPEVRVKKKAPSGVENQAPSKKQKTEGPVDDYSKDNVPVTKVESCYTLVVFVLVISYIRCDSVLFLCSKDSLFCRHFYRGKMQYILTIFMK